MSSSFLATGQNDSLQYYLGIYQSMFPHLSFDNLKKLEKKSEIISKNKGTNLKASPLKPYVIQIGAFGNIVEMQID